MINIKSLRILSLLICIIIIIFDQYTKYYVNINYNYLIRKDYIIFTIDYVKNYGAAFNILNGSRILLSSISIIISIFLIYLILVVKNINRLNLLSYNFILAGTVGNGYDRIIKGYVLDFINLNFINFPVFNIADISINIGFIFILYGLLRNKI